MIEIGSNCNYLKRMCNMNFLKPRKESPELKLFRSLHNRMVLPEKKKQLYESLEKGYSGELKFDRWLRLIELSCEAIVISDLLIEINNTLVQIDSLMISPSLLYLFEVKNLEGDYYVENGKWYSVSSGKEIKDPLLQVARAESLVRRLFQDFGFQTSMEPFIIFINPHFTLYQAPQNKSFIFPTQLDRFNEKLTRLSGNAKPQQKHSILAEQLLSMHQTKSPYTRLPPYSYEGLRKGITCKKCYSFMHVECEHMVACVVCGEPESIDSAVIRSANELILLFPDKQISTNLVFEWCEVVKSKKTIRRVLKKYFQLIIKGKRSYFVSKNS